MTVTQTPINRKMFDSDGAYGRWAFKAIVDDGKLSFSNLTWLAGDGRVANVELSVADFLDLQNLLVDISAAVGPALT